MSDEIEQIVLADTVSAAVEEPSRRRGIFGLKRRSKLPPQPLTHCENCGAPLAGEFCSQCGQHAIDYRRSIFRVLLDAADSFLNWDTKFLHSMNHFSFHRCSLPTAFTPARPPPSVLRSPPYLFATSFSFFLPPRS